MKSRLLGAVCAIAVAAIATPASAVTIDYSNTSGSTINLNPADGCGGGIVGCFDFTPNGSGAASLQITSGSAATFTGRLDGLFGVNSITSTSTPIGTVENASVTGTGTLYIYDGAFTLSASLSWVDIATFGTASSLNPKGTANLSSISYSGTNADLLFLANAGAGTQTATFQFTSPMSLTDLFTTATATTSTSFSGSISAIPVPPAVWLFGSGLLGLAGIARRKTA